MFNLYEGLPIFQNTAPVSLVVTLTFSATAALTAGSVGFQVVPAGTALPIIGGNPLFSIYPKQTMTVVFDVPSGSIVVALNNNNPVYVTWELENILWGRG